MCLKGESQIIYRSSRNLALLLLVVNGNCDSFDIRRLFGMKKLRDIVHYSSTVSDILVVCLVSLRTKNSILSISPLIIITEGSSTVQQKKVSQYT